MSVYKVSESGELLCGNPYPGRGIIVGLTADGTNAAFAYFIMGRSENSRNRIFSKTDDGIIIYPYDSSKVKDPSLIIYSPVRRYGKKTVVTNGDQTDTVIEFLKKGSTFEAALDTRCFEPDAPNFTPRISAILDFENSFTYKMSILKSADAEGTACNRYCYSYAPVCGVGHFIHTYISDGNPLPTFCGEPERVSIDNNIDKFVENIWSNLNKDNKISLYAEFINIKNRTVEYRMINGMEKQK